MVQGGSRLRLLVMIGAALALAVALVPAVAWGQAQGGRQGSVEPATKREIPRRGGTLIVAGGDPGPLNPAITSSGMTHPVTGQIFNGLVRLDREFNPEPDLAESWKVSDDQRTYTFTLAPKALWHDGKPVTSADVKYTFEQVLLQYHPRTRVALGPILESITTPSTHTVVFRLKQPYAPFLRLVNEDNGAILPKHIYEGTDPRTNPANERPVGSGPFMFGSKVAGQGITLVRNPRYFKPGRPYLDHIEIRFLDGPAATQAFLAGQVHFVNPGFGDVKTLETISHFAVTEDGREGFSRVVRLIPNLRRRPYNDVRVRQAMAYAIDREALARRIFGGLFEPATGPFSRGLQPYYTADVDKYPYDPARARALLDQAGLAPGAGGVRFRSQFIYDASFRAQAQLIRQNLGQVGIALDLKEMSFNDWVKKLYIDWDFDLGYSNITDPPDPDIGVKRVHTCANIVKVPFANGSGYCNPRVDELFAQAAAEPETESFPTKFSKRARIYREIQQILVQDQPNIFLVDGKGPYAYRNEFTGFRDAGSSATYYFGDTAWWRYAPPTRIRRTVSLRFPRGSRVVTGRVSASSFPESCANAVSVEIHRKGKRIKSTLTDVNGAYRLKLRRRSGRYRAVSPRVHKDGGICLRGSSPVPRRSLANRPRKLAR